MNTNTSSTFDILLLIARPAAGKSEIIYHLKNTPVAERRKRFRIDSFVELDDFPMLWTWFEEDALLEEMGHPRLHSTPDQYFKEKYLWNLLIERLSLEYSKLLRDQPDFHREGTVILEFARGSEHGGYREAFQHLSREIAEKLAILYVDVSWEESLRKNRARYNPERPDSILEHGLSDEKMETLYRQVDWADLTKGHPTAIPIQGVDVPYTVFENHDDVTSLGGNALSKRLAEDLERLYDEYIAARR